MAVQIMALIDTIVAEIEEETATDLKNKLINIKEPLEELQLYLERDKKNPHDIMAYFKMNFQGTSGTAVVITLGIIDKIVEETIESRKDNRELKKKRIDRLNAYNWDLVQK